MMHEIKIRPEYYEAVLEGKKKFELRFDDRKYAEGDVVKLMEYDGGKFTGRCKTVEIAYVLRNVEQYGLSKEYCIFGWR